MKPTCLDGLHFWSAWQPDRRMDFNAFFLPAAGGGLLVDPLAMDAMQLEFVREHGGAAFILHDRFVSVRGREYTLITSSSTAGL